MHLQDIILTGYLDNTPAHYTVAAAHSHGFIISKQVVLNAYIELADEQWVAMDNGSYEPSINNLPF